MLTFERQLRNLFTFEAELKMHPGQEHASSGAQAKNTRMNCKLAGSLLLGGGAPVPVRHTERSQVLLLVM